MTAEDGTGPDGMGPRAGSGRRGRACESWDDKTATAESVRRVRRPHRDRCQRHRRRRGHGRGFGGKRSACNAEAIDREWMACCADEGSPEEE